jgi:hypothetical protein
MTLLDTYSDTITPDAGVVWLKNVGRPFLNRTATVIDFSAVQNASRGALVQVLGRRLPVALTEVQGAREYVLTIRCSASATPCTSRSPRTAKYPRPGTS